jgi:hypothetical protein
LSYNDIFRLSCLAKRLVDSWSGIVYCMQREYTAVAIKIVPRAKRKVEYERERLLGIANKFIRLLAIL